ncbi:FunK1 protein kinase [Purpureocillium lavendulum]|uniref:FunK1 protein kinase n=1 Tax=Purpureocillium lavendulum TaxID=1247861 RepID=A0AB34FBS9_9HYPO|nr:FunK1 protein kinase [Purpureocillium lavendulum]
MPLGDYAFVDAAEAQRGKPSEGAQERIDRLCLTMAVSWLDHQFKESHYDSTPISGLAVMGIRDDGGWVEAVNYTPVYSAVIKVARKLVVYDSYLTREDEVAELTRTMDEQDAREEATSIFTIVHKKVQRFMMVTSSRPAALPTPMDWIFGSRTYGMFIRYNTAAGGTIDWDGDSIKHRKIKFTMDTGGDSAESLALQRPTARDLRRLVDKAVDHSSSDAGRSSRRLKSTLESLQSEVELLRYGNRGLRETIIHEKQGRQCGKTLKDYLFDRTDPNSAQIFSPAKVAQARLKKAEMDAQKKEEALQEETQKIQRQQFASLTPSQLARKRANDRKAQRAMRIRTREYIERLERELKELKSKHDNYNMVHDLLRRNKALGTELATLGGMVDISANVRSCPGQVPAGTEFLDEKTVNGYIMTSTLELSINSLNDSLSDGTSGASTSAVAETSSCCSYLGHKFDTQPDPCEIPDLTVITTSSGPSTFFENSSPADANDYVTRAIPLEITNGTLPHTMSVSGSTVIQPPYQTVFRSS